MPKRVPKRFPLYFALKRLAATDAFLETFE